MKTIKIIDLLNLIANGEEVPEKIQVYSDIFVFENFFNTYKHEETRTNLLSIYNGNILNYKAEIIEEDKKIKRLDLDWVDVFKFKEQAQQDCVKMIFEKINKIIDKLNEEEK